MAMDLLHKDLASIDLQQWDLNLQPLGLKQGYNCQKKTQHMVFTEKEIDLFYFVFKMWQMDKSGFEFSNDLNQWLSYEMYSVFLQCGDLVYLSK